MSRPARGRYGTFVLAGWLALALVAAVWLAIDRRPPEWDHANHLERAVLCAHDLRAGDVRAILERSSFYPPVVLCMAGALHLVMPAEAAGGVTMVAFLGLGMLAVYALGGRLAGARAGAAAALLFGAAPFVVFSTLKFQLDLPLASMVALALVVLLATEDFTRRGAALALGVVCGVGMLTKPTFILYIAAPAVLMVARGGRRALPGVALATVVAAALSLPWFGPRLLGLGAQVDARAFAQAAESGHPEPFTLAGLLFYPKNLGYQVGLATVALTVAGIVVAILRRQWYLLVAALTPFLVLQAIQNKNLRYSLPVVGALAVVAALALDALPARIRRVTAVGLVLLAVVQITAMTARVPPNFIVPGLKTWWLPTAVPTRADWHHREILALLDRDRRGSSRSLDPVTVSVVPNFDLFSVSNFRYYAVRDGVDIRFVRAWDDPPLGIDYMVLKTGDVGPSWTAEKSRRAMERLASDPSLARVFPVIGEFPLPDGSTASVRARRIPPLTDVPPPTVAAAVEAGLRARLGEVARDVEGLDVRLAYDEAILAGRIQRARIQVASARLGEFARPGTASLRVQDMTLTLEDVLVNPWSAREGRGFAPLDVGRLRLESATIAIADLQAYVAGLKKYSRSVVTADGDALAIVIRQSGPDVRARVRMASAPDRPFALNAEGVRVGGVPVPDALVNWVIRNFDPTPRIASRVPFPVEIGRVTVRDQALRISREGTP